MGELVALAIGSARRPLSDITEAFSGARLERAILPGGESVVVKFLPPEGDWLTRATQGTGRLRHLWESSLLRDVEPFVDHTILDMDVIDGQDVVVAGPPDAPGVPLLVDRPLIDGAAAAYVCRGFVCDRPVTTVEELTAALLLTP